MTVAAAILAATPASALADADGTPGARRLADVAWAGGATPVVVCSFDPDGAVAAALANAEVTLADPVDPARGPVGQIVNGIEAALRLVTDTDAALVWPARLAWVDAETVTTLIAAHGEDRSAVIRPAYRGEAGFPVLLPVTHLEAFRTLGADRMPGELFADLEATGVPFRLVETGDPGVTHDVSVAREDLPPYDGPPEPAETPEWGAAVADEADDSPARRASPRRTLGPDPPIHARAAGELRLGGAARHAGRPTTPRPTPRHASEPTPCDAPAFEPSDSSSSSSSPWPAPAGSGTRSPSRCSRRRPRRSPPRRP